ncbi:Regulator of telomere elongation helicase 1 [Dimargaris cristalligena]|nr:Regulator of telomere elongation helicase 1 [Dimargaris cristalligena]
MPALTIRHLSVQYPFEPYACQLVFMEKVITALQEGTNALLESPTGTGKTLCLLCASLAWLEAFNTRKKMASYLVKHNIEEAGQAPSSMPFQIWATLRELDLALLYSSRTHSQLSQVIKELKGTSYGLKIQTLGSRDQMCINPQVKNSFSRAAQTALCRVKVKGKSCQFYTALTETHIPPVLDIEELVQFGTGCGVCPYYAARQNLKDVDAIFLPYDYLLDADTRRAQGINLQQAIIIFDEAHNLESKCDESRSVDLNLRDLDLAIAEVQSCEPLLPQIDALYKLAPAELETVQTILQSIRSQLLEVQATAHTLELTKPGLFISQLLDKAGLHSQMADYPFSIMEKVTEALVSVRNPGPVAFPRTFRLGPVLNVLKSMVHATELGLSIDSPDRHSYRVHIKLPALAPTAIQSLSALRKRQDPPGNDLQLSLWCFNPGLAMTSLVKEGVRSVVLASGTLAPLDSFATELKIDFPVRLENSHVIETNQVSVMVVPRGPGGQTLTSSYSSRNDIAARLDLGRAIVNYSRVVPHGLLVFFTSYTVMADTLKLWQSADLSANRHQSTPTLSIWERISQHKAIFVEPKGKAECEQIIQKFYEQVHPSRDKGAALFAVCRGKVSEGIDFANERGRAVIITGLPYSSYMEPKVMLKKEYLDEQYTAPRHGLKSATPSLSGEIWYRQQAIRAVNQALGRVIRHKNDFGAIILCDERFASAKIRSELPAWIQPYVQVHQQFGTSIGCLTPFFRAMENASSNQLMLASKTPHPVNPLATIDGNILIDKTSLVTRLLSHIEADARGDIQGVENSINQARVQTNTLVSVAEAPTLIDQRSITQCPVTRPRTWDLTQNSWQKLTQPKPNVLDSTTFSKAAAHPYKMYLGKPTLERLPPVPRSTKPPVPPQALLGSAAPVSGHQVSVKLKLKQRKSALAPGKPDPGPFLKEIKLAFSLAQYSQFQRTLRELRAKHRSPELLISKLAKLFSKANRLDLFLTMLPFFSSKHHALARQEMASYKQ